MQRIFRKCFSKLTKNLITALNLLGYLSFCFGKVGNYCLVWCDVMKYGKQLRRYGGKYFFLFSVDEEAVDFDWLQYYKMSHPKRKSLLTRSFRLRFFHFY